MTLLFLFLGTHPALVSVESLGSSEQRIQDGYRMFGNKTVKARDIHELIQGQYSGIMESK